MSPLLCQLSYPARFNYVPGKSQGCVLLPIERGM